MAEEIIGSPPAPETSAPAPAPSSPPGAPAGVSSTSAAAPSAAPSAPAPFQLRQYMAEQLGNPAIATQYADDQQFAMQLAAVARQIPVLSERAKRAEYWDKFAPHAGELEKWLADKTKAAAPAAGPAKWWNAPQFDPSWMNGVEQDANGRLVAKAGYPPDLPSRIEAYRQFQREKFDQFTQDPIGLIKPGIEEAVGPMIEKAIQERLASIQENQSAQAYVQQNIAWLAQRDQQGNALRDPITGQLLLTGAGNQFRNYVEQFAKAGVPLAMQQALAERLVEGDLLRAAMAKGQVTAQTPGVPAPEVNAIAGANRIASAGANPPARQSLRDAIAQEFARAGVTDDQLRNGTR